MLSPATSPSAAPCTHADDALTCPSQTEMLLTFTTLRDVCSNRSLSKEGENVPKLLANVAERVSATSVIHIVPRDGAETGVGLAHLVGRLRPRISLLFGMARGDADCCVLVLLAVAIAVSCADFAQTASIGFSNKSRPTKQKERLVPPALITSWSL